MSESHMKMILHTYQHTYHTHLIYNTAVKLPVSALDYCVFGYAVVLAVL